MARHHSPTVAYVSHDERFTFGVPSTFLDLSWIGRDDLVRSNPDAAVRLSSEEARLILDNYTPRIIEPEVWDEIGAFVRDAALTAAPQSAYSAHRLAAVLTSFVAWTCHLRGMPQDAAVVFRRSTIQRYIEHQRTTGALTEGTLRNYRAMLYRVQEVLVPNPALPPSPALNKRSTVDPYSEAEVRLIRWWTTGQNTGLKIRKAMALSSLCLGAGLRAKEVIDLTAADIQVDDAGVLIHTAGREVPLLAEWEQTLLHVLQPLAPSDLVFGSPTRKSTRNALSDFVGNTSGSIKPRSDRMRATWLVTQLRSRTDIRALMRAAGITKFENLISYIEFIPELDNVAYRQALRLEAR